MDLETITGLFSGSPLKPLQQHRGYVLEALLAVNRQVLCLSAENPTTQPVHSWVKERPQQLEKLEQEIISRLNRPSFTAYPRQYILNTLQNQSHLAHQVFRLSERLNIRPLKLPVEMFVSINQLTSQFGKTIFQFNKEVSGVEQLKQSGLGKKKSVTHPSEQSSTIESIRTLRSISEDLKDGLFHFESHVESVDAALLSLVLDDIIDLSFWLEGLVIQQSAEY